jgi:hypothetical protein
LLVRARTHRHTRIYTQKRLRIYKNLVWSDTHVRTYALAQRHRQRKIGQAFQTLQNVIVEAAGPIVTNSTGQGPERVLLFLKPNNPIRRFCAWLEKEILFNVVVILSIIMSCVLLILTPAYEDLPGVQPVLPYTVMKIINFVLTSIFSLDFVVRAINQGLFFTRNGYFKSGWNVVDFIVLVFAWIDESGAVKGGRIAMVFRLARALRPLRLMKRNEGMRIVIDTLICTFHPVAYVIVFSVITICVFAVVGLGLFGGKLFRCNMPGAEYPAGKPECSGMHTMYSTGYVVPRVWSNPSYSFDNYYDSILTLFRINTVKYVQIIYDVQDITTFHKSPKQGYSTELALFLVVYLIVGALFVMNLFVGFIVDGFNAHRGTSEAETQYLRFQRLLNMYRPRYDYFPPPRGRAFAATRRFVRSRYFQVFSSACVFMNVIFMLSVHAHASEDYDRVLHLQNLIFFGEIVAELVIFTIGFGPGCFVNDHWKGFDLFVAVFCTVGYVTDHPQISQFVKVFRLMRILRLLRMIRAVKVILDTMMASVSQLVNILFLLGLVYSMFAVVAVQCFGTTKRGYRMGPTANFDNWNNAIMTIAQIITGDEWMDILYDCSVEYPACTRQFNKDHVYGWTGPAYSFGDCGSVYARLFFVSLKLICENVMLNLFIGMILGNFSFITEEVEQEEDFKWSKGASSDQMIVLVDQFRRFDARTGYMSLSALYAFMCEAHQPLGFRNMYSAIQFSERDRAEYRMIRAELNLICDNKAKQLQEEAKMPLFRRIMAKCARVYKLQRAPKSPMAVSFDELMYTLLYWRKPSMVPLAIKHGRHERIHDTLNMAFHITIYEAMRRNAVQRRRERLFNKAAGAQSLCHVPHEATAQVKVESAEELTKAEAVMMHSDGAKPCDDCCPRDAATITAETAEKPLTEGGLFAGPSGELPSAAGLHKGTVQGCEGKTEMQASTVAGKQGPEDATAKIDEPQHKIEADSPAVAETASSQSHVYQPDERAKVEAETREDHGCDGAAEGTESPDTESATQGDRHLDAHAHAEAAEADACEVHVHVEAACGGGHEEEAETGMDTASAQHGVGHDAAHTLDMAGHGDGDDDDDDDDADDDADADDAVEHVDRSDASAPQVCATVAQNGADICTEDGGVTECGGCECVVEDHEEARSGSGCGSEDSGRATAEHDGATKSLTQSESSFEMGSRSLSPEASATAPMHTQEGQLSRSSTAAECRSTGSDQGNDVVNAGSTPAEVRDDATAEEDIRDDATAEEDITDDATAEEEDKEDATAEEEDKEDATAEEDVRDDATAEEEDKEDATAEEEDKEDATAEEEVKEDATAEEEDKEDATGDEGLIVVAHVSKELKARGETRVPGVLGGMVRVFRGKSGKKKNHGDQVSLIP